MKKKAIPDADDDLRPHYGRELFRNMKPNPYAGMELKFKGGGRAVILDEDVAEVFDQETANTVLRCAIKATRTAAPAKVSAKTVRAKRRA